MRTFCWKSFVERSEIYFSYIVFNISTGDDEPIEEFLIFGRDFFYKNYFLEPKIVLAR